MSLHSSVLAPSSLYSIESDTKSPYWLGTVFTASVRHILMAFALQWLTPMDEPICVQQRVSIFWSLKHKQNWANGVSVYLQPRCGIHFHICSNILLQAANISENNWKHTCLGKPMNQPPRNIEEWTHLLTYPDKWYCSVRWRWGSHLFEVLISQNWKYWSQWTTYIHLTEMKVLIPLISKCWSH